MRQALADANYTGFIHDHVIWTPNCSCVHRRRVDFRKHINETILAIEVDEYRHSRHKPKDEEERYNDLYMAMSGKWIFIRFNPDKSRTDKTPIEERLQVLMKTVAEQIKRIEAGENVDLVEIIKLYY